VSGLVTGAGGECAAFQGRQSSKAMQHVAALLTPSADASRL